MFLLKSSSLRRAVHLSRPYSSIRAERVIYNRVSIKSFIRTNQLRKSYISTHSLIRTFCVKAPGPTDTEKDKGQWTQQGYGEFRDKDDDTNVDQDTTTQIDSSNNSTYKDSETAVMRAIAGNAFITTLKMGAWISTGSSAMFGEAIHSLCDLGNQAILWRGLRDMQMKPDSIHNYGYGRSAFFWGLVSALGTFWLGCGFTVYHGVGQLFHPHDLQVTWHVWTILGLSFMIDGYVFKGVLSSLRKQKPANQSWKQFIETYKDPFIVAVLMEDAAACTGVLIAATGMGLSVYTGNSIYDALASIAIGGILGSIAYTLVKVNQRFLLGQAVDIKIENEIRNLLLSRDCIEHVYAVRSQWVGPYQFSFKAEVDFDGTFLAARLFSRYESHFLNSKDLKSDLPLFLSWYAEDVTRIVESEVRDVEAMIRKAYPEAAYIELEPDSKRTFETSIQGVNENTLRALERAAIESAIKKVAQNLKDFVTVKKNN